MSDRKIISGGSRQWLLYVTKYGVVIIVRVTKIQWRLKTKKFTTIFVMMTEA
jgi:hypothetical protein